MKKANELTATEARREIAAGRLTSEQLTRACLEHIAEREPAVGAWQHLAADAAIARARELDRSSSAGLLYGIPIAVKDFIDTADMPTTYGSAIYADHQPAWDAPCVALSRAAGAVILGKTVSTAAERVWGFLVLWPRQFTCDSNGCPDLSQVLRPSMFLGSAGGFCL